MRTIIWCFPTLNYCWCCDSFAKRNIQWIKSSTGWSWTLWSWLFGLNGWMVEELLLVELDQLDRRPSASDVGRRNEVTTRDFWTFMRWSFVWRSFMYGEKYILNYRKPSTSTSTRKWYWNNGGKYLESKWRGADSSTAADRWWYADKK